MTSISTCNQFVGIVDEVNVGAINAEVYISLKGDEVIVASITKQSIENLAIKKGSKVLALVNPSQVIIVTDFGGYRLSARNQLQGTITNITYGEVSSIVEIKLKNDQLITVAVTNECIESLILRKEQIVTALFKAGAVIIALAK